MQVLVKTFDLALAAFTPESLRARSWSTSSRPSGSSWAANFRFGQARSGDLAELMRLGEGMGFAARALPIAGRRARALVQHPGEASIAAGDFADVFAVLGRPHALTGTVVRGDQGGEPWAFPPPTSRASKNCSPRMAFMRCSSIASIARAAQGPPTRRACLVLSRGGSPTSACAPPWAGGPDRGSPARFPPGARERARSLRGSLAYSPGRVPARRTKIRRSRGAQDPNCARRERRTRGALLAEGGPGSLRRMVLR